MTARDKAFTAVQKQGRGHPPPPPLSPPILRCRGLTKAFGGLMALAGLELDVGAGEIHGVIGPNGAGKTTLLNLLSGSLVATAGWVEFGGRRTDGLGPVAVSRLGLARTYQIPRPFGRLTVLDNVLAASLTRAAGGRSGLIRARDRAGRCLELTGLADVTRVEARALTLAGRKRLELARALATEPRLLLLDETAAGLNPSEVEVLGGVIEAVRDSGVTIILVEHVIEVVLRLANRLTVLFRGRKLAEGPPGDVLREPRVLLAYFGGEP